VDCTSVGHGSIPYFSTVSGIIACPFLYSVNKKKNFVLWIKKSDGHAATMQTISV
jgi:hypothetical protein